MVSSNTRIPVMPRMPSSTVTVCVSSVAAWLSSWPKDPTTVASAPHPVPVTSVSVVERRVTGLVTVLLAVLAVVDVTVVVMTIVLEGMIAVVVMIATVVMIAMTVTVVLSVVALPAALVAPLAPVLPSGINIILKNDFCS